MCVCVRFLTADTHGAEASRVISTELSTSKDCEDVDNEPEQNNNIKDGLHAHNKARNDGSKHGHTFDQRQKTDETEHPQTSDSGAASSAHGVRAHDDKEIEGIEVAIVWVREVAEWLRTLSNNFDAALDRKDDGGDEARELDKLNYRRTGIAICLEVQSRCDTNQKNRSHHHRLKPSGRGYVAVN